MSVTFRTKTFFDEVAALSERHVHLVLIATKPDIIKQVPLYLTLKRRGHQAILGHTGQHYDENLSGGMLKEFGVEPDFNLNVRGSLHEVIAQIIDRLGGVIAEMVKRGKIVIPYVHGDTTTAMAASNAGFALGMPAVHVEAGIRTLVPRYRDWELGIPLRPPQADYAGQVRNWKGSAGLRPAIGQDPAGWHRFLMDRGNWERGSMEPIPEQFNTRCSEAGSALHLAPVELDREFLLGEGFPEDRVVVVGNSVVDAVREAQRSEVRGQRTVFEKFPMLERGDFVRFCIHRRENCTSEKRFRSIVGALQTLIEEGRGVLLISLFQTEAAIDRFGLRSTIEDLVKHHKNFIYSPVWSEYGDVIAVMEKAAVCATDSGSMQEEMNALGVPCVTLRFGSDRSESAIAGGNLIAPPVDASIIHSLITYAWDNAEMRRAPKLYGSNVSSKCIDAVEAVLAHGELMRSEEKRIERM